MPDVSISKRQRNLKASMMTMLKRNCKVRFAFHHPPERMLTHETECALGVVTDKTNEYMKHAANEKAKEKAKSAKVDTDVALRRHKYVILCTWSSKRKQQAYQDSSIADGIKCDFFESLKYQQIQVAIPSNYQSRLSSWDWKRASMCKWDSISEINWSFAPTHPQDQFVLATKTAHSTWL